ncbi:MAG: hypothetical protein KER_03072 [Kerstersia gyiorum]|uniref:hypothetical protein n=1 Tax=Kerstersia gyiorum TaxID=206506 RepID=UPI0030D04DE0
MSVTAYTHDPNGLLQTISRKIDKGDIASWELKSGPESAHLHHKSKQWAGFASFHTSSGASWVSFYIKDVEPSANADRQYVSAVYHSDLVQMLLAHCHEKITNIQIAIPIFKSGK